MSLTYFYLKILNRQTGGVIEDDSITTQKLADGSITTSKLASDSVITTKILNNAITENKLNDDSINSDKIEDFCIGESKIADNTLLSTKFNSININKFPDYRTYPYTFNTYAVYPHGLDTGIGFQCSFSIINYSGTDITITGLNVNLNYINEFGNLLLDSNNNDTPNFTYENLIEVSSFPRTVVNGGSNIFTFKIENPHKGIQDFYLDNINYVAGFKIIVSLENSGDDFNLNNIYRLESSSIVQYVLPG